MNVRYVFSSLNSIADYFAAKAADERAKISRGQKRLRDTLAASERAAVFESVADLLRNTDIKA